MKPYPLCQVIALYLALVAVLVSVDKLVNFLKN